MTISNGSIIVNDSVTNLDDHDANVVEFCSTGGTFTAAFGGDYYNIVALKKRLGLDFTATAHNPFLHFKALDNEDGTFTVSPGIYCWQGTAEDGDWNNALNWAYGRIPVDNAPGTGNDAGLTMDYTEFIVFNGNNMPTLNVPAFGGSTFGKDTPSLRFNRGGAFTIRIDGYSNGLWTNTELKSSRLVFRVGDGIGGSSSEDVSVTIDNMTGQLNRHCAGVIHILEINSDGTLIINGNAEFTFSNNDDRWAALLINGGSVEINGAILDLYVHANNRIEFNSLSSTLTAQYGGDFPDLDAVRDAIGVELVDNVAPDSMRLAAYNSDLNSFVVLYEPIPPDGTILVVK